MATPATTPAATSDPRAGTGREKIVPKQTYDVMDATDNTKVVGTYNTQTGKPPVTAFDIIAKEQPAPTSQPDWDWNPQK
ncbi:hypothetical protein EVG80_15525 [Salmonella enterica subsp. enterica serovar Mississippi]|nr:hypothetical protein [Salmonella enterica subsp. enterica serovar Mississippi]